MLLLLRMVQCWGYTQSGNQWITLVCDRLPIDYSNAMWRWRWWHSTVHNGHIMRKSRSLLLRMLLGRWATCSSAGHTLLQMLQYLFDSHMRGQIVIILLARRLARMTLTAGFLGAQYIK